MRGGISAHAMSRLWCGGGLGKFATRTIDGLFVSGWLGAENGFTRAEFWLPRETSHRLLDRVKAGTITVRAYRKMIEPPLSEKLPKRVTNPFFSTSSLTIQVKIKQYHLSLYTPLLISCLWPSLTPDFTVTSDQAS